MEGRRLKRRRDHTNPPLAQVASKMDMEEVPFQNVFMAHTGFSLFLLMLSVIIVMTLNSSLIPAVKET